MSGNIKGSCLPWFGYMTGSDDHVNCKEKASTKAGLQRRLINGDSRGKACMIYIGLSPYIVPSLFGSVTLGTMSFRTREFPYIHPSVCHSVRYTYGFVLLHSLIILFPCSNFGRSLPAAASFSSCRLFVFLVLRPYQVISRSCARARAFACTCLCACITYIRGQARSRETSTLDSCPEKLRAPPQ